MNEVQNLTLELGIDLLVELVQVLLNIRGFVYILQVFKNIILHILGQLDRAHSRRNKVDYLLELGVLLVQICHEGGHVTENKGSNDVTNQDYHRGIDHLVVVDGSGFVSYDQKHGVVKADCILVGDVLGIEIGFLRV